jgi:hypothetical protein
MIKKKNRKQEKQEKKEIWQQFFLLYSLVQGSRFYKWKP